MITQMQDTVYIHRCSHSSFQTLQILIFIIYVIIIIKTANQLNKPLKVT